MAAIDKVCEFSGEYPGGEMWNFKRNHIQIMPTYRKLFRGHKATLHIFEDGLKEVYKGGSYSNAEMHYINPNPTEENWDNNECFLYGKRTPWGKRERWGMFFDNIKEYKQALKLQHMRLLMQYAYILEVPDLPGQVHGMYSNYSFDLKAVKRRLGRMVGKKNLTIIKHSCTMSEFYKVLE